MQDRPPTQPMSRRRVVLERLWIAATVLYGVGKALVVWKALGDKGVNPWVYGVIDVTTSFALGLSTARTVGAAIDRDMTAARAWGALAVVTFFAPDIYIVVSGRNLPGIVYAVLAGIAAVTGTLAVRGARRKYRAGRRTIEAVASTEATIGSSDDRPVAR
jgi:hypothetical protein